MNYKNYSLYFKQQYFFARVLVVLFSILSLAPYSRGACAPYRKEIEIKPIEWQLIKEACANNIDGVRSLLAQGTNKNTITECGNIAVLMIALHKRDLATARLLLASGARHTILDDLDDYALERLNDDDIVRLLSHRNAKNSIFAFLYGLYDSKSRVYQLSKDLVINNIYPYVKEAVTSHVESEFLLYKKIHPRIMQHIERNERLIFCSDCHNDEDIRTVKRLLDQGADPNSIDYYGDSVLTIATRRDNNAIIGVLIRSGAHCGFKNRRGETALDIAWQLGNTNGIELLLKHTSIPRDSIKAFTLGVYRKFKYHITIALMGAAIVGIVLIGTKIVGVKALIGVIAACAVFTITAVYGDLHTSNRVRNFHINSNFGKRMNKRMNRR